ncbi:gliding motility-associated lipoprotein GldH [Chitinophaga sp. CF118]|uniref:gliding motility lipoprotein GldH n=1 Tax=Chitinophaga sp. CF118 TaxID=1884367 RepID=UPI0008E9C246|nr:gliding motility lipoprotein GldH [Chitinophaga sp. CF118]SFD33321.1 gliding motility-associated lipoprotein GldH [Chitinophaga sp. CF118]
MNNFCRIIVAAGMLLATASCQPMKMDTYEKNLEIPGHQWSYSHKPVFEVTLQPQDTAYVYNIYVNVRHKDSYPYSNIWLVVNTQFPEGQPIPQRVELPLADMSGKWLGSGLDDIYEHQIPIQQRAILNKPGTYRFTFEQNMRQNPLPDIMNVGLRIEKAGLRQNEKAIP